TATNGATINLYAKWTPIKYTINFEGNGATGGSAPPKMPMAYDTAKNLPSNTFVRNGYTFAGWELDGKNYAVNASVNNLITTDGATVTFLAQWKANGYNIVFDGNGADSGSTAPMSMTYDDVEKALTKNGFTKDEYMFTGWARDAKGAVEFNDEQEVRNLGTSGTVTLYAQWRYTPQLSGTRYFMVPTYLGTKQHPQSTDISEYDVWFTAKRSQSESFFAKHVLHADEKVVVKGKIKVPTGENPAKPKDIPEEIHTTIPQDPKK
ncbi:MAG: InlB B-repeat-containing protein, partial [Ruthenibacterium sp.]